MNELRNIFFKAINLSEGTDIKGTIDSIRKNIEIRGYNVWILACGAILASIGLDTNSPAVIIGAMLISPLMAPILGIGLSVGINDRDSLILALENFGVAVGASLLMSTLYFSITPLGVATPEILSRTQPTLLDVGVAIFGGIAGIVAGSRKEKTNAIPGVAIATALMPPLCVAGFGLANAKWDIFLGAFYLFFLNSVFIALSTYTIVRFLHFPYTEFIDLSTKRKVIRYMVIFSILVIVPSTWFMINIIRDLRLNREINQFIVEYVNTDKHEAFRHDYLQEDSTSVLKLYITGEDYITQQEEAELKARLKETPHLAHAQLKLIQFNVPPEDRDKLKNEVTMGVLQQMELKQKVFDQKQAQIDSLRAILGHISSDTIPFGAISRELKSLYPELTHFAYGMNLGTDFTHKPDTLPIFILEWDKRISSRSRREKQQKITQFLKLRLQLDTLQLISL
ncbi:MAG: DUF389 domain-containing protein [Bacteroidetes bacterium]|nr:MAG: DUF389 domain-containing protein [Bacteroidota bacterium]